MKKLVIFANKKFKNFLFEEIKNKKYLYLKEVPKNRINLSNGTRYTFEILDESRSVEIKLRKLEKIMMLLNVGDPVQSTMSTY